MSIGKQLSMIRPIHGRPLDECIMNFDNKVHKILKEFRPKDPTRFSGDLAPGNADQIMQSIDLILRMHKEKQRFEPGAAVRQVQDVGWDLKQENSIAGNANFLDDVFERLKKINDFTYEVPADKYSPEDRQSLMTIAEILDDIVNPNDW